MPYMQILVTGYGLGRSAPEARLSVHVRQPQAAKYTSPCDACCDVALRLIQGSQDDGQQGQCISLTSMRSSKLAQCLALGSHRASPAFVANPGFLQAPNLALCTGLIWNSFVQFASLRGLAHSSAAFQKDRQPGFVDAVSVSVQAGRGGAGAGTVWGSRAKGTCRLTALGTEPTTDCCKCPGACGQLCCCLSHDTSVSGRQQPPDGGNGGRGGDVVVCAFQR